MIMMIIAMIMWLMKQKVIMISAKIEGNQQHHQALQQQHQQLLLLPLLLQEHMMEIMRMWMIIFVGIRKRELTTSMTSAVKHLTAWL